MTDTSMTVVKRNLPMALNSMQEAAQLAIAFAQAHVMGAQNAAEGMLAVVLINEIGLVKAEETRHIMMGRITKKASAILSDFIQAGGEYEIVSRTPELASAKGSFGKNKDVVFSFSWEDALKEPFVYAGSTANQRVELAKPNVAERHIKDKYATPRSRMQMLWARVVSDMGNTLYPASSEGLYPPEVVSDFDEIQNVTPAASKPIDASEAQERAQGATDAEPEAKDYFGKIDYTLCPINVEGYHLVPWVDFATERLEGALKLDHHELTATHKAAIRVVLEQRKEGDK